MAVLDFGSMSLIACGGLLLNKKLLILLCRFIGILAPSLVHASTDHLETGVAFRSGLGLLSSSKYKMCASHFFRTLLPLINDHHAAAPTCGR